MNVLKASPTPAAERLGKDKLRMRTERLLKLLDLSAPLPVLAAECVNIHMAAVLGLGQYYFGSLGREEILRARQDAELCENCDNSVKSGHGLCELCLSREEQFLKEIEDGRGEIVVG